MDQIKIGKFIASMRKEQSMTQRQLADVLNISDKTVSKWECGNGMPEVALMLPAVWAFTHPDSKPPLKGKDQATTQSLIDPAGYRYITLGLATLTLILLINIEVFKNAGWDPFGSWASTIAILAFCIVATVLMFWSMYKSIQK